MNSLLDQSNEELRLNFKVANDDLGAVFSKYPTPLHMETCPCCVDDRMKDALKKGVYDDYISNAVYTWGTLNDFKHFIPKLFHYVFLENHHDNEDNRHFLLCKFDQLDTWKPEEQQVICQWFDAYIKYQCIPLLKQILEKNNLEVTSWTRDLSVKLTCIFPFEQFLNVTVFNDLKQFLSSDLREQIIKLLDIWPHNETDFIVYASCLAENPVLRWDMNNEFGDRATIWIETNDKILEDLFWKATNLNDLRLQKLYSDALL